MRVLVVEDERALREQLVKTLQRAGYAVDATDSGEEGVFMGSEYPVDVAVLDLGLPDLDGLEVLSRWRSNGHSFPVLVLTARGRWTEKVEGLETGADDYLTKPFHIEEVLARLRALVRRASGFASTTLSNGPIELDISSQEVRVGERDVDLTAYEYRLLEYLMMHPGEVISKTTLSEHLYDEETDRDSNVVEVLVGRLRRKLDPDRSIAPIETLRGRGYRMRAPPADA
ncbi:MAG: response regulator transcription factor [Gammaproteobacteria bacterium]|nr:response regulator transcription factor [Gammaproteobacteria bacterium]